MDELVMLARDRVNQAIDDIPEKPNNPDPFRSLMKNKEAFIYRDKVAHAIRSVDALRTALQTI